MFQHEGIEVEGEGHLAVLAGLLWLARAGLYLLGIWLAVKALEAVL